MKTDNEGQDWKILMIPNLEVPLEYFILFFNVICYDNVLCLLLLL